MSRRILSPGSNSWNSGEWLFDGGHGKGSKWSQEENKMFETALALHDRDTPDRWIKVAAMIPGKAVGDVITHYRELEEDISDIEAGLIPIPGYTSSAFTLEWADNTQSFYDGFREVYTPGGKRASLTHSSDHERKKGIPWTEEEHRKFLLGLKKYGKGDWRNISQYFVTTRTPTQVASHAQKFFLRQLAGPKDKRRSSIHDITTVNTCDDKDTCTSSSTCPSSEARISPKPDTISMENGPFEWKSQNRRATILSQSSEISVDPTCYKVSSGLKLQDQRGKDGGPSQCKPFNAAFQMQSMNKQ